MKKFLPSPRQKKRGIALILVLACLVLLTIMVLAFLATTNSELQSSKFYANGSSVKLLAQSATDLVMGEIRDATQNGQQCWASQPGMIRDYDNTGAAVSYYKLYSDGGMVGTGTFNSSQTLVPDGTGGTIAWYQQPGVYVDLNEPVTVNGVAQFPIVDGNASDYIASTATMTAMEGIPANSQVIGPALASGPYANQPLIAGFSLANTTPVATGATNQAPMPVKWLYVLKDGSIAYPDNATTAGNGSGTVTFSGANTAGAEVPSQTNPIVGRIAFWTDDETSKVNINTAGDPITPNPPVSGAANSTVWDYPRTGTSVDVAMSQYQPAQNEFQRYPGHPSTVSLSTVLGNLSADSNFPECIYSMMPRLTGSVKGTLNSTYFGSEAGALVGVGSLEGTQVANGALGLTAHRLFDDTDELLFQPVLSGGVRVLNNTTLTATTELDSTMLRKSEFFLTAHSRAPDVNLFNQPRVCIWPVSSTPANWTPSDQLIAFCSTINGFPYYIQRGVTTPTTGANDQYSDLPNTPATGTGTATVNRNRNILEYLRTLTQLPEPGFGGVFQGTAGGYTGKYNNKDIAGGSVTGTECDQILTEIFDYIRSTNSYDQSTTKAVPYACAVMSPVPTGSEGFNPGIGQVVPIVDTNGTRGFGRFPTLYSASMVFFPLQNTPVWTATGTGTFPISVVTQVQAVLLLQFFDPSQGFPENVPWYQIQVSGLTLANPANGQPIFQWGGQLSATSTVTTSASMFTGASTGTIGNPYGGNFIGQFSGDPQIGGMCDYRRLLLSLYNGSYTNPSDGTIAKYTNWNPAQQGNLSTASNAYIYTNGTVASTSPNSPNQGALFSNPFPSVPPTTSYLNGVAVSTYTKNSPAPSLAAAQVLPPTLSYAAGNITISLYNYNAANGSSVAAAALQTLTVPFPGSNITLPTLSPASPGSGYQVTVAHQPTNTLTSNLALDYQNGQGGWQYWLNRMADTPDGPSGNGSQFAITFIGDGDSVRSAMPATGDMRLIAARQTFSPVNAGLFYGGHLANTTTLQFQHNLQDGQGRTLEWAGPYYNTTSPSSVIYGKPLPSGGIRGGAGGGLVSLNSGSTPYLPTPYNALNNGNGFAYFWAEFAGFEESGGNAPAHWSDVPTQTGVWVGQTSPATANGVPGDWDNGLANYKDGAYINKADEGNAAHGWGKSGGYFDVTAYTNPGATFFSPNREIPSAGMFGSLPTGVLENLPWQTLLFRPGPAGHPGLATQASTGNSNITMPPFKVPPDSLLLDLFSMPVVEPYAISEPLSTAGRINMNYQIVPFTYINRSTAVQAALRSVDIETITSADGAAYKQSSGSYVAPTGTTPYRLGLNMAATLSQFAARFSANDIFRSAAEICSVDLVPSNCATPTAAAGTTNWRTALDSYWNQNALTGDNTRERPYADLYPLLTTKSNTFTIHYRVQTLKPSIANASPTVWREGIDTITGEYRGSQTVERYVDPNDTSIPDFTASPGTTQSLASYYRFRVVSTKQFAP